MTLLSEWAYAKVNLTLRVKGRRADGYHELESLVAFAGIGDHLELTPLSNGKFEYDVKGRFAAQIDSRNLITDAIDLVRAHSPISGVRIVLEKNLPVSAGIGGGSSDAAAALRLMQRLMAQNSEHGLRDTDWLNMAQTLGSDVPVCFYQRPTMMRGRGEILEPVERFPTIPMVVVNPGQSVPTPEIFRHLNAGPIAPAMEGNNRAIGFDEPQPLVEFLAGQTNDLETTAISLYPEIARVRDAIEQTDGCQLARMSGSGATCFGLFDTAQSAATAAKLLHAHCPDWWVRGTKLMGWPVGACLS